MVWSAYLGLPLSLKDVGMALGLDKQKLTEGKELIRYFCNPDRDGARHLPSDAPDKWAQFKHTTCATSRSSWAYRRGCASIRRLRKCGRSTVLTSR